MKPQRSSLIDRLIRRPIHYLDFEPAWQWNRAVNLAKRYGKLPKIVEREYPTIVLAARLHAEQLGTLFFSSDRTPIPATIRTAHQIWADPSYQDMRWTIEAFIMADASAPLIAEQTHLSIEVVEMFNTLFYDIRELLKFPAFINGTVFDLLNRLEPGHREASLKRAAWIGGADLLMRVLHPEMGFTPEQEAKLAIVFRKQMANSMMEISAAELDRGHSRLASRSTRRTIQASNFDTAGSDDD